MNKDKSIRPPEPEDPQQNARLTRLDQLTDQLHASELAMGIMPYSRPLADRFRDVLRLHGDRVGIHPSNEMVNAEVDGLPSRATNPH